MSLRCVSTFILTKTWNKWLDGAAAFVISCLSFLRSDFKNSGILCISTYFTNHNLVFCHSANHLNVKLSVTLQNQYYVRQNGCPRFKEPQAVKWWCRVNSNEQLYSCTLYKKAIEIKKKKKLKSTFHITFLSPYSSEKTRADWTDTTSSPWCTEPQWGTLLTCVG